MGEGGIAALIARGEVVRGGLEMIRVDLTSGGKSRGRGLLKRLSIGLEGSVILDFSPQEKGLSSSADSIERLLRRSRGSKGSEDDTRGA